MPVPLVVALGALLAAGSAAAESGSSFEVDFTHLLGLNIEFIWAVRS